MGVGKQKREKRILRSRGDPSDRHTQKGVFTMTIPQQDATTADPKAE